MVRSIVAISVLGLVGMFGYFFLTNNSNEPSSEKAKHAIGQVGDTLADQGIETAVAASLKAAFGSDAKYLHVHYDDGQVTVYGMAPASLTVEQLEARAGSIPGVKTVHVYVQPLPAHLGGAQPAAP